MKYFLAFLTVFVLIIGCVSLQAGGEVYEGSAEGYRGMIRVRVRVNEGVITEIIVLDDAEDRFVGGAAIEELADLIIEHNSADVDAVSGATFSSKGFLEAVNNAIIGL